MGEGQDPLPGEVALQLPVPPSSLLARPILLSPGTAILGGGCPFIPPFGRVGSFPTGVGAENRFSPLTAT